MITASVWLTKIILAHLLTDFIFQPGSWVADRKLKHFASIKLYLHGAITALVAWAMIGWEYWQTALVIWISHTVIDGWKSYQKSSVGFFLADQLMHVAVIIACWYFTFIQWTDVQHAWQLVHTKVIIWKVITAFVFITSPAGILIGQFTRQWRDKIPDGESLANAGKWIGMMERIIILIFVLYNQFSAIGLLVAAKGIIRFNEKDRPEIKTEYLVIGTLMSIAISIITGLVVQL